MAATPSVLVFDVNETLIDIESIAPLFGELFGDERVLREWFGQLVLYSMTATLADHYVDFFALGQGVLRMLADIHGLDITDGDLHRLESHMRTMPAHPDVEEGLTTLRDNGFRLATLTNSPHRPLAMTPLEHAGLAGFFEQQLSVEACRAFKPSPSVYRYACQMLGVQPGDCMMVAAHVWDTLGAQNVGFSSALITRPGNPPLPVEGLPQPTLVVSDLRQLAERLGAGPS
ncbi:haloacid dehalogenase [Mycobacterium florentinum]|uniref:Haloacid dehalogenase n=1 Tax=Mycobacterium florentinum TaxID=292462 RepID=A0A1X1U3M2_MYCFL|nr:haloacid dehalogenase type II [Mycobacterium florentinum]MCV7411088.1 haloacid dehalogenase type II [Mycobacterium florentinum]ORV51268.1 haloacid dehalogenase [Mycobacterium florentinum]BBX80435.1 haloacid dehalogenase [Mycobacterium florentinum]